MIQLQCGRQGNSSSHELPLVTLGYLELPTDTYSNLVLTKIIKR